MEEVKMFRAALFFTIVCVGVLSQRPYYRKYNDIGCDWQTEDTDPCPNKSCRREVTCEDRASKQDICFPDSYLCDKSLCFCKEGFARQNGNCINLEDCPKKP